jgi:hypothetical protein
MKEEWYEVILINANVKRVRLGLGFPPNATLV